MKLLKKLTVSVLCFMMLLTLAVPIYADTEIVIKGIDIDEELSSKGININYGTVNLIPSTNPVYKFDISDGGAYKVAIEVAVNKQYSVPMTIYANDVCIGTNNYQTSTSSSVNGFTTFKTFEAGVASLKEGSNLLKVVLENSAAGADGTVRINKIVLTKLEAAKLESIFIGEEKLEEGKSYARGTDFLKISYSDKIDEDSLSDISLSEVDGNSVETDAKLDSNETDVIITLKDSLEYGKTYALAIEGVKDSYGADVGETNVEFDVIADSSEDSGADSSEITEFDIIDGKACAKGVIKSSMGVGISGRTAELYVTEPGGAEEKIGSAKSGKDGKFTIECDLKSGNEKGTYKARVLSEYGDFSEEKTCHYLPETLAKDIWLALEDTKTADDVFAVLDEHSEDLEINLTDDIKGIEDASLVYARLTGADVSNMNEFVLLYNGAIAIERINQAKSVEEYEEVFGNSEYLSGLFIPKNKIEIIENTDDLFAEIWRNKPYNDLDALAETFDSAFNEILKEQLNFSDVILSQETIAEGEKGGVVSIDILASEQIENVKEISLSFEFDTRMSGEIGDFSASSSFGNAEAEINDNICSVKITDIGRKALTSLAQISFIAQKVGNAGFTASGFVTIETDDGFDVILEIEAFDYSVTIMPAVSEDEEIKILGKDYASVTSGYTVYGNGLNFTSACTPVYEIKVPYAGVYDVYMKLGIWQQYKQPASVYVNGESLGSVVYYTGEGVANGWQNFKEFNSGSAYFKEGVNTLKIQFDEYLGADVAMFLQTITIKKAPVSELFSFKIGEKEYSDRFLYPRGTDYFVAEYTGKIDEESLSDITVTEKNGNSLAVKATLDESKKKIIIAIKETLDYDSTYTVTLKGVKDLYGLEMNEEAFEFKTIAENETDSGSGKAEINSFEIVDGKAKITGISKSSQGEGIKGRFVTLYIYSPSDDEEVFENVISGDDGKFEAECTLLNIETGTYLAKVKAEYGYVSEKSDFYYIPESVSEGIWLSLKGALSAEEVKDIIERNSETLGINQLSDLDGVDDELLVYGQLKGIEITDVYDFKKKYTGAIALEKINQASTEEEILSVLSNDDYTLALNISKDMIDAVNDKAVLAAEILKADRVDSVSKFAEVFNKAFNETLKKQAELSDIVILTDSDSAYVGQETEIEINAKESFSHAKEIDLEIVFADGLDDFIELNTECDFGTVSKEKNGNKLIVSITGINDDVSIEKILKLSFGVEKAGIVEFTVKGTVSCDSGTSYDVLLDIKEQNYSVAISNKESSNPVSSNKGSSGGGGGGSFVPPAVDIPSFDKIDTEEPINKYAFVDIEGVEWAKSSIQKLLSRQALSMPEDCLFHPDRNVTRAEFAKMIVLTFDLWINSNKDFEAKDVDENSWYYGYIYAAYSQGIMGGDGNGYFNPEANITREDMCVMVARAIKMKDSLQSETFSDDNLISAYAKNAVYYAKGAGIINGVGNNMFNPKGYATRAMAAKVVCGALEVVE